MIRLALPVILAACVLTGARGISSDREDFMNPSANKPHPAPTGLAIYKKNKCMNCHAIQSQGIKLQGKTPAAGALASDLSDAGIKHNADWMQRWLTKQEQMDGKKHVKKFAGSANDLKTLATWLDSLKAVQPLTTRKDTSSTTSMATTREVTSNKDVTTTKEVTTTKAVTTIKDVPVVKETPVKKPTPPRVSAGAVIFEGQKCAKCHSVTSQGIQRLGAPAAEGAKLPPDLSGVGLRHTSDWMQGWLKKEEEMNGKKHMKLFSGPDEDLKTLTNWLASLKKQ